jgi:hypothetical protein
LTVSMSILNAKRQRPIPVEEVDSAPVRIDSL